MDNQKNDIGGLNLEKLRAQAEDGDNDSIKTLLEINQREQEEKLRKDLFGV